MVWYGLLLAAAGTEAGIPWWGWLLIGIGSTVVGGALLKVGFDRWGRLEKNRAEKKAANAARFLNLNEDLARLARHMSETRERPPSYLTAGCTFAYAKDTWKGELRVTTKEQILALSSPAKTPDKVHEKAATVDKRFGEYREALRTASTTFGDRLNKIVFTRFGQDVPFPAQEFKPFLGIWADSVLRKKIEANEAADSMAGVFFLFYGGIGALSHKRNNSNLPDYPATEMAEDIIKAMRELGTDPEFKAQRKRLRATEKDLKKAVKAALASIK